MILLSRKKKEEKEMNRYQECSSYFLLVVFDISRFDYIELRIFLREETEKERKKKEIVHDIQLCLSCIIYINGVDL